MVRLKDKFEAVEERWIVMVKRMAWIFLAWMVNGVGCELAGDHVLPTYSRYTWEVTPNHPHYNPMNDTSFLSVWAQYPCLLFTLSRTRARLVQDNSLRTCQTIFQLYSPAIYD